MGDLSAIGRLLIGLGLLIVVAGAILLLLGRFSWPGRLPGDLRFSIGRVKVNAPIATSIIVSVLLTLLLNVIIRVIRH